MTRHQCKQITFTFLDATNLPSRDQGHMNKVVFRFLDDDHFTSQWTWHQDGKRIVKQRDLDPFRDQDLLREENQRSRYD